MQSFDNLFPASEPIHEITEEYPIAAILREVLEQLCKVELAGDQFDVVDEPPNHLQLGLLIHWMDLKVFLLNVKGLHLLHDSVNLVKGYFIVRVLVLLLRDLDLALLNHRHGVLARRAEHARGR